MASKKLILGLALVAGAAYMLTRKKKDSNASGKGTGSGGNTFQLTNMTDTVWNGGVGILPFDKTRGWGSDSLFLVNKEYMIGNKVGSGTRLKMADGSELTVSYVDTSFNDYDRIAFAEVVSDLVGIASYPAQITIVN